MGLICGIVVLFDLKLFGVGMLVVIGFVFDCLMLEMFVVFEKVVQKVLGCVECYVVIGEFDYFMFVCMCDNDSFNWLYVE